VSLNKKMFLPRINKTVPQDDLLFQEILAALREQFGDDLQGVLAAGSRIYGRPGPTSDLDVHVVTKGQHRRRCNRVMCGVEVEFFVNPVFQIRRYLYRERKLTTIHMFAFGQPIYDPLGVMADLQTEARILWEAGPAALTESQYWTHRYRAADILRDVEDVIASDEATANLLIVKAIEYLLEGHYQLKRRWLAKPKYRLADLESWDEVAAVLARRTLGSHQMQERWEALVGLAEHVLAPIGGVMPLEWQSEWEELQP
jgi:hypothetical protein